MLHSCCCCGGGNVLLRHFPLFTSRHMKVVNTPADVMMQTVRKVGRQKYLRWWMNTWRCMAFFTVCVLLCVGQCEEDLVTHYSKFSLGGENLWNQTILRFSLVSSTLTLGLLFSKVPHGGWHHLPLPPAVRVHSCSSSSSWSSSMASIWVLEDTSLIGAESSPSTTSSLDISLFFCRETEQKKKPLVQHSEREKGPPLPKKRNRDHCCANLTLDTQQNMVRTWHNPALMCRWRLFRSTQSALNPTTSSGFWLSTAQHKTLKDLAAIAADCKIRHREGAECVKLLFPKLSGNHKKWLF